jgi:dienelactone hydrolase
VQDLRGKPLSGARVFLKDMKSNVVRTLQTDQNGEYKVFALTPTVDYEVYAEFKGKTSDKKVISSFLNREDNVLNFQLDVAVVDDTANASTPEQSATFKTYDLVELHASFDLPLERPRAHSGCLVVARVRRGPSAWKDLSKELLNRGWAVMSLDLRGHGESRLKNQRPIQASPDWRTSLHEFPLDLDPALDWLKSRSRVDNRKIAVIGFDVGANLALIASGRFQEVRTVVAIKPNLEESLALAGSAQDFQPRSSLIVAPTQGDADRIKAAVKAPSRVVVASQTGGTSNWTADPQVKNAIFSVVEGNLLN